MAFVLVIEAGERFAVGQFQPTLGTLQGLDVGLLVYREDHGVLWRLQIERHDVGGLWANAGSVRMHQLRRRSSEISCSRSTRQTWCLEILPRCLASRV